MFNVHATAFSFRAVEKENFRGGKLVGSASWWNVKLFHSLFLQFLTLMFSKLSFLHGVERGNSMYQEDL